jgi:HK97 family phage major capsid protein/HK97 family phage prohead protease
MITKFAHNSTTSESEPDWGSVDKTSLPRVAFADQGDPDKKSTWSYPHHWVSGGGEKDESGIYTYGTLYLHAGGLNAAWSAANGGRSGEEASQAVKDHLQAHRRALGLEKIYSTLTVKGLDEEMRVLEGIASTPTPDRMGDVVVPEGMQFKTPFPFLYQHNPAKPIGQVIKAIVSSDGLSVQVKLAPKGVADYIDEAWALIKSGLVRGLSIGFRSLEESWDKTINGYRYLRTEIMELSAVTIPANAEATITTVKSFDSAPAAFGRGGVVSFAPAGKPIPGVSGQPKKGKEMKTLQDQIASFEAKRAADVARMTEIMNKSGEEGRTLDESETQEYDGLQAEVKRVDEHLVRLKAQEKLAVATAVPVTDTTAGSPESASRIRGSIITVKAPNLPPGTAFARYAIALATAARDPYRRAPHVIAEQNKTWMEQTPQVARVLKTAVGAGTTTTDGWASELSDYTWMASEFIEYLRPMTIIGRIAGFRRVPFNIKMPLQDSGSTGQWVGEGVMKPVNKLHFDTATLRFSKIAGIVVLTDECVRFSSPSIEAIVRQDLANCISQFMDEQFIDPTVTESANVSPASITQGAHTTAAGGTTAAFLRSDFKLIAASFGVENIPLTGCYWVMLPNQAVALQMMLNALGAPEFPNINGDGGTLLGYPVVTSNSVPSGIVAFFKPAEIFLADDGGVTLDASREASIEMDDGTSEATATTYSMWQHNMVALRAERYINWKRRRHNAVYYLSSCAYSA